MKMAGNTTTCNMPELQADLTELKIFLFVIIGRYDAFKIVNICTTLCLQTITLASQ